MEQGITGVEPLLEQVKHSHNSKGYIIGMDGRKVYTRSEHSALNTLLQHTGAMLAKVWIIKTYELIEAETNWEWEKDYKQLLWVHDELQFTCRPDIADQLGDILCRACLLAGEYFNCALPIEAEYKIGKTWRETH
jgi:DNA polymerase I-like protein with 3'-5' exonuclease and polymerase domains